MKVLPLSLVTLALVIVLAYVVWDKTRPSEFEKALETANEQLGIETAPEGYAFEEWETFQAKIEAMMADNGLPEILGTNTPSHITETTFSPLRIHVDPNPYVVNNLRFSLFCYTWSRWGRILTQTRFCSNTSNRQQNPASASSNPITPTSRSNHTPAATSIPTPSPTATPIPTTYFTVGSLKEDVSVVQGIPDSVEDTGYGEEWWYWEHSWVVIKKTTGIVSSWHNTSENLKVKIVSGSDVTDLDYFTIGSHQDDVFRLQGMPDDVTHDDYGNGSWFWEYDQVTFDIATGGIHSWYNNSGKLSVRIDSGKNLTDSDYFAIGSHQDDVLRIQGMPESVEDRGFDEEVWAWNSSVVVFDIDTKKISNWQNVSGNLRAGINSGSNITGLDYFSIGSHRDDVLRLQGIPENVWGGEVFSGETWDWGNSSVSFDNTTQEVESWDNSSGVLKARQN